MPRREVVRTTLGNIQLNLSVPENSVFTYRHVWHANRHSHADYELHIILRGSCTVDVEGTIYTLHAGQGILILPNHFHSPISYSPDFDKLILDLFPTSGRLVADPDTPCVVLNFPPATVFLADELLAEYASPASFHQKMIHSQLTQLTIHLLRLLSITDTETSAIDSDLRVDIIDSFFARCLRPNVTKEQLCAQLHLSPRQLHRFLETRYGMSFQEKLVSTRMTHAGWLLRDTDLPVQQVALQVGYSSVPAFTRSFVRFHGKTPLQFRKQRDT